MAGPIVQSSALVVTNGAGSSVVTLTNVTAGNALVVTASLFDLTANITFSVKDGSTAFPNQYKAYTPGGNYSQALVAWELAVAAGSHAITLAPSNSSTSTFYAWQVHEVAAASIGSATPTVTTSGTTTGATLTLAGGTPPQSGDLIFTAIADDGHSSSSTTTATTPSGYTSLWSNMAGSSSQVGAAAYQVQTTAAPVAPSWTGLNAGGGAGWAAVAVAFAPAGGSTNAGTAASSLGPLQSSGTGTSASQNTGTAKSAFGSLATAIVATATAAAIAASSFGPLKTSATGTAAGQNAAVAAGQIGALASASTGTQLQAASASGALPALTSSASQVNNGVSQVLAYASKADPNQGSTTSPLITAGITTPATGSTIIVNLLTQSTSTAPVGNFSDSYGNTWTLVATNYYAGGTAGNGEFPSYLLKCVNAKGGPNHTFQLTKNSVQDECTIYAVVLNGGDIGNWTVNTTGTYAGSVTTSGPNSTVLSFWSPNDTGASGYVDNYHAPSGWTQMANNNNAYNSMSGADAYLSVPTSGTAVTATWTADNTGGGINPGQCMYMVEVTAPAGGLTNTGTATGKLAALTTTSQGTQAQSGAAASAVPPVQSSSAANSQTAGGASSKLSALIATATGAQQLPAQAASNLPGVASQSSGSQAQSGASTAMLAALQSSGTGTTQAQNAGTASSALAPVASAATGTQTQSATGQPALPAVAAAATATAQQTASASSKLSPLTSSATPGAVNLAQGSGGLPTVGSSVTGEQGQAATGASALAALAALASQSAGQQSQSASATCTLNALASQAAQAVPAVAASALPPIQSNAVATEITTLSANPEWQYYAAMAARSFYAAMPFRSFYVQVNSNMATSFPSAIDPRETKVLTLDATADLPAGVTLTCTPQVTVTVTRNTDANAAAHFTNQTINTTPVTVANASGATTTIAPGLGVQIIASGCLDACWYEVAITCPTTQPNNVETLKAVLACTAS